MDVTIGSLCSGIGGLELGIEQAVPGSRVIWQVERDPFCRRVLAKHWPGACRDVDDLQRAERLWATCRGNIFTTGRLAPCDVLCAGFPCQDLSVAGKGAGLDGARSGLFWDVMRVVRAVRPRVVVLENVAALVARGLDVVLGALASCGYDAVWDCIPAAAVGAPHRRDRVFVVAWRVSDADSVNVDGEHEPWTGGSASFAAHLGAYMANAAGERAQADYAHRGTTGAAISCVSGDSGTRGTLADGDERRREAERQPRVEGHRGQPSERGTSLTDATCRSGRPHPETCTHGGQCRWRLNPRFVEWLMGFPPAWTLLGCER